MNDAPSQPDAKSFPVRRRVFVVGFCLFAVWVAGLITLVVTASNPVTLNVAQLREADCVVVAVLKNAETGEFELDSVISGAEPPATFQVVGLAEFTPPEADRWLMPLYQERGGNYSVVPVPYRDTELLLVYPATDDVVADARRFVGAIVD